MGRELREFTKTHIHTNNTTLAHLVTQSVVQCGVTRGRRGGMLKKFFSAPAFRSYWLVVSYLHFSSNLFPSFITPFDLFLSTLQNARFPWQLLSVACISFPLNPQLVYFFFERNHWTSSIMPLLKHKHAYKSDVGPSIIVKRIQDDDTFVDFREYNGYEQWTKVKFVAFSTTFIYSIIYLRELPALPPNAVERKC